MPTNNETPKIITEDDPNYDDWLGIANAGNEPEEPTNIPVQNMEPAPGSSWYGFDDFADAKDRSMLSIPEESRMHDDTSNKQDVISSDPNSPKDFDDLSDLAGRAAASGYMWTTLRKEAERNRKKPDEEYRGRDF